MGNKVIFLSFSPKSDAFMYTHSCHASFGDDKLNWGRELTSPLLSDYVQTRIRG